MELEKIQIANVKSDDRALEFYYHPTFPNTKEFVNAWIRQLLTSDWEKLEYIKFKPWQKEIQTMAEHVDLKDHAYEFSNISKGKIWMKGYSSKLYINIAVEISTESNTIVVSSSDLYVISEYMKMGEHKKKLFHEINTYVNAEEIAAHIALQTDIKKFGY